MTPSAQHLGCGLSWLLAVAAWVEDTQKHLALIAAGLALVLTVLLIWNAFLDNAKKRREEREAHQKELKVLQDAACAARQLSGACPKCNWNPPQK